jgi:hypothetical protein
MPAPTARSLAQDIFDFGYGFLPRITPAVSGYQHPPMTPDYGLGGDHAGLPLYASPADYPGVPVMASPRDLGGNPDPRLNWFPFAGLGQAGGGWNPESLGSSDIMQMTDLYSTAPKTPAADPVVTSSVRAPQPRGAAPPQEAYRSTPMPPPAEPYRTERMRPPARPAPAPVRRPAAAVRPAPGSPTSMRDFIMDRLMAERAGGNT